GSRVWSRKHLTVQSHGSLGERLVSFVGRPGAPDPKRRCVRCRPLTWRLATMVAHAAHIRWRSICLERLRHLDHIYSRLREDTFVRVPAGIPRCSYGVIYFQSNFAHCPELVLRIKWLPTERRVHTGIVDQEEGRSVGSMN